MARKAPLSLRLGPQGDAALDALCQRWRCSRVEAVRRALEEAADRDMAMRPVMEALGRIEARCSGAATAPAEDVSALEAAWGDD